MIGVGQHLQAVISIVLVANDERDLVPGAQLERLTSAEEVLRGCEFDTKRAAARWVVRRSAAR